MLNPNFRRVLPAYFTQLFWTTTFSITINGPVLPLYVKGLGVSVVDWGALVAAFAVGMLLFEWVWGSVSDRTNPSLLLALGILCMSAIFALYTIHGSFLYFLPLQLFAGIFGVMVGVTTRAYVSEKSPSNSVGFYVSVWSAFSALGRVIGPLVGTFIAQTWSFEYSFYASSILSVILAVLIFAKFPSNSQRSKVSNGIISNVRFVLHARSARFLFIGAVLAMMAYSAIQNFLPLYAARRIRMSTIEVGVLIAAFATVQLISMPTMGWISSRLGKRRVIITCLGISACSFLLYLTSNTSTQIYLVSMAVGVGLSGSSLLLAMIPDVAPKSMYGTAIGLYGSFEDLGVMLAPLIYGFVWSALSPVYVFAVSSFTQILCVVTVLLIEQKQKSQSNDYAIHLWKYFPKISVRSSGRAE